MRSNRYTIIFSNLLVSNIEVLITGVPELLAIAILIGIVLRLTLYSVAIYEKNTSYSSVFIYVVLTSVLFLLGFAYISYLSGIAIFNFNLGIFYFFISTLTKLVLDITFLVELTMYSLLSILIISIFT